MRTRTACLLLLFLAVVPATGAPAAQDAPRPFPASIGGRLGRALVDAINGERADREAFVRTRVSRAALDELAAPQRVDWLQTIAVHSGGLDVRTVSGDDPLEIVVQTRRGGHWRRIYAFVDPLERERLREYGCVWIRDPALASAVAWPQERLDEAAVVREIERQLEGAARRDEFSGVVLVAREGRVLFHRACGLADKSWEVPNRPDTKFNLASMNKMFTAVAIAQLVESGTLRFQDKLIDVLPEYPNEAAAGRITIEHLLTHTAGLGMLFDRPGFDRRKRYRAHADYFPLFAAAPLHFEPGSGAAYSNEGYVVLGAVIEKVTGRTYFDHVRERVFEAAGMSDTDSYALDDVVHNLATGYARFEDDPLQLGPWRPNWIFLQWKGSAAGGGYSTAPDLLKFVQALRGGKLLGRETASLLTQPHGIGTWYGYGFLLTRAGGREVRGHGGGGPGSGISSELGWFEDGSDTVIVLANYDMGARELYEGLVGFLARQ